MSDNHQVTWDAELAQFPPPALRFSPRLGPGQMIRIFLDHCGCRLGDNRCGGGRRIRVVFGPAGACAAIAAGARRVLPQRRRSRIRGARKRRRTMRSLLPKRRLPTAEKIITIAARRTLTQRKTKTGHFVRCATAAVTCPAWINGAYGIWFCCDELLVRRHSLRVCARQVLPHGRWPVGLQRCLLRRLGTAGLLNPMLPSASDGGPSARTVRRKRQASFKT